MLLVITITEMTPTQWNSSPLAYMMPFSSASLSRPSCLCGCPSSPCLLNVGVPGPPWWLSDKRIHLPIQETRVRSPIWGDPTCFGTTKPKLPQLLNLCPRALEPQLLKPTHLRACAPQQRSHCSEKACTHTTRVTPHSPQLKESPHSGENPAQPK